MNVVQMMVTIIIVTILVTVILGVVSYIAYWLRRSRRPLGTEEPEPELRFFYRYVPEREEASDNGKPRSYPNAVTNDSRVPADRFASAGTRGTAVTP